MQIITYRKEIPLMKSILGIALAILGLTALVTGSFILGLIFIAIGLNLLSTEGSQINITDKKYRTIKSIFGIDLGSWKPCPEFEYVSIFRTTENQTVNVVTANATVKYTIILLNLFYGNKHITFYKTTDKDDALKVAKHFRLAFNIDILDATEKEKIWLT